MPDVFLWMISNGKRIAYHRFTARDLIYADKSEERGRLCGKMQTLFMKVTFYYMMFIIDAK